MMIAILTIIDNNTDKLPSDSHPLFDELSPLAQLQLDDLWLSKGSQWRCHETVLNCQDWAKAWSKIQISPVAEQQEIIGHSNAASPIKMIILIANNKQPQSWSWYQEQGLLLSAAGNWYQIPPSLREALVPITKITTQPTSDTQPSTES